MRVAWAALTEDHRLKQQDLFSLSSGGRNKVLQSGFLLRAAREGLVLGVSWPQRQTAAFLCLTRPPHACLSQRSLLMRTPSYWIRAWPHEVILTYLPVYRSCLQIQSQSEVLQHRNLGAAQFIHYNYPLL